MLWLLLAVAGAPAMAAEVTENDLKAAFVYNFAKFAQWPDAQPLPMRICLLNEPSFAPYLNALEAKQLRGSRIVFEYFTDLEGIEKCAVLYVGNDSLDAMDEIVTRAQGLPMLVIGLAEDFVTRGGTIGMVRQGKKMAFDINMAAASSGGLRFSSKLLRLARVLLPEKKE